MCVNIVIHRLLLYLNSSVWRDTREASSWNRNPANFVRRISYPRALIILNVNEGIFYLYIFTYTLSATGLPNS